jgi:hypothetical protein
VEKPPQESTRDWPLWWFARLEAAIERGDRRAAAESLRQLDRLGIEVRFTLPPARREAVNV